MLLATFGARRIGDQRLLLAVLFAATLLTSATVATVVGYLAVSATAGLREALVTAEPGDRAVRFETPRQPDGSAQIAAGDAVVAGLFDGLPVDVIRRTQTMPQQIAVKTAGEPGPTARTGNTLPLVAGEDFDNHAVLVDGAWPRAPDDSPATGAAAPGALPATAAAELGLRVGDVITVGGSPGSDVRIVATWRPRFDDDPFWLTADAESNVVLEPDALFVGEQFLDTLSTVPRVSWTVTPDPARLTPAQLGPLITAVAAFDDTVRRTPAVAGSGSVFTGGLPDLLLTMDHALTAVGAAGAVPIVVVAAVALIVITGLARLLIHARRSEAALLTARGASIRQVVGLATVEAVGLAVPAAGIGLVLAAGGLAWSTGDPASAVGALAAGWPAATLVALIASAAAAGWATSQARRKPDEMTAGESGRVPAIAGYGGLVVLIAAAVVGIWRFRSLGSAVVTDNADASTHLDPIALLAPAIALVAFAVLGVLAWSIAAGGVARLAARRPGIGVVLPARQVARRGTVFGAALLVTSLALGVTTLAAVYAQTWTDYWTATDRLQRGADVRIELARPDDVTLSTNAADPPTEPAGTRATAVLVTPARAADTDLVLTALDADAMTAVLLAVPPAFDPGAVSEALRPSGSPPGIPAGSTELTVDVKASAIAGAARDGSPAPAGAVAELATDVWLAGSDGSVRRYALGVVHPVYGGPAAPQRLSVALSGSAGGWQVLAVDVTIRQQVFDADYSYRITGPSAADHAGWVVRALPGQLSARAPTAAVDQDRLGWTGTVPAASLPTTVRLTPASGSGATTVPVVIDIALAGLLDVGVGDRFTLQLTGTSRQLQATVALVSSLLPGDPATPKAFADLRTVVAHLLRTTDGVPGANQIWLSTDRTPTAALSRVIPPAARIVQHHSTAELVRPALVSYWWGAAGALLLAAMALGTVAATLSRERRGEVGALRALGLTAAQQAGFRRRELISTVAVAWVLGIVVGVVVGVAAVPGLVRATVSLGINGAPDLAPALSFGGRGWLLAFGAQAVLLATVILAAGEVVRRQALAEPPMVTQ